MALLAWVLVCGAWCWWRLACGLACGQDCWPGAALVVLATGGLGLHLLLCAAALCFCFVLLPCFALAPAALSTSYCCCHLSLSGCPGFWPAWLLFGNFFYILVFAVIYPFHLSFFIYPDNFSCRPNQLVPRT
jgi:hypothetical protein